MKAQLVCVVASTLCLKALALPLQWNVNQATAQGSGCNGGAGAANVDTQFLANGGDLSVVFTRLGIEMHAGEPGPLSQSRYCNVTVPLTLAAGYSPLSISQVLSFGITKSVNTAASLYFRSAISGNYLAFLQNTYPSGQEVLDPLLSEQRFSQFQPGGTPGNPNHCANRLPSRLTYAAYFGLQGQRASIQDDLLLLADAFDLRLEVDTAMQLCPPSAPPPPPPPTPTGYVTDVVMMELCGPDYQSFPTQPSLGRPFVCVRSATTGGTARIGDVYVSQPGQFCSGGYIQRGASPQAQSLCVSYSGAAVRQVTTAAACPAGSAERGRFTSGLKLCLRR